MTSVPELKIIHRAGNFYVDLMCMSRCNKEKLEMLWLMKMLVSIDLFGQERNGKEDWIIQNERKINELLNGDMFVFQSNTFHWVQMVVAWLIKAKVTGKPCDSPHFFKLHHPLLYQHINEYGGIIK